MCESVLRLGSLLDRVTFRSTEPSHLSTSCPDPTRPDPTREISITSWRRPTRPASFRKLMTRETPLNMPGDSTSLLPLIPAIPVRHVLRHRYFCFVQIVPAGRGFLTKNGGSIFGNNILCFFPWYCTSFLVLQCHLVLFLGISTPFGYIP